MAILVTGGTGYIGSHTVVELVDNGYDVVIVDNLSNSNRVVIDRLQKITGIKIKAYFIDMLDYTELSFVFEEHVIEAVIHFAGYKSVGESVAEPIKYYKNNLLSTLNLVDIMGKNDVKQLIFSSSATVYGEVDDLPITEDFKTHPLNPYGRTKLMNEEILKDLSSSDDDWKISLLRYFNPVGAHRSGLLGENPNGVPTNLMPFISKVAAGDLSELKVFGDDYDTPDGTGIRDYIHVTDLAKGHLKALENIEEQESIDTYNLGTGEGYSVKEVIQAFEQVTGNKIPYKIVGRRDGDVPESYAEPTKALNKLGWKTEKGITEMCEDTWNWQQKEGTYNRVDI
ncbi:UDP-glucose 4-epimerase GalE [Thalassobacillus devorans]|uniref:UDP-glucose 4-epimerase GalE n=1 Tax=Thalassobacillus devorans TaxID=279813 RepID=UPI00048EA200|nr:UDP-glucose 4-epimerase GalE [Thalassobacillus devorans]